MLGLVLRSQTAIFSFYCSRTGKNRVWNAEQQPLVPSVPDFQRVLIGDDYSIHLGWYNYNRGVNTVIARHRKMVGALVLLHNWPSHWWSLLPIHTHKNRGMMEPKLLFSIPDPIFSRPKVKRKNSSLATRDYVGIAVIVFDWHTSS